MSAASGLQSTSLRSLTTRQLDFWLLGGFSLLVWAALLSLEPFKTSSWAVGHHFKNLPAVSATLALLCNYPHFMVSYKLAYGAGPTRVLEHWFQLIAVPIGLAVALFAGVQMYAEPVFDRGTIQSVNAFVAAIGLDTRLNPAAPIGKQLLGFLANLMFFTVGWHYSKQVFGCMMLSARYDEYPIDRVQRAALKAGVFSIWWASYASGNATGGYRVLFGIPYLGLGLPAWTYWLAMAFFVASSVAIGVLVLYRNHAETGRRPSPTFLVPYLAFGAWWIPIPALVSQPFFLHLVPFFHGLQYLTVVYRVESTRNRELHPGKAGIYATATAIALVATGFLCFELIPTSADAALGLQTRYGASIFFVVAMLFINIHHYFIDSVIWRFKDPKVRRYLLD